MPNKKISQLVNKTTILSTDLFPIGDATSGQLYKKTIAELQAAIGGAVISVNGLVGTVVLDTDDIQELVSPTNKWFTDARARGAVSATSPLAYNSSTGVFSIPAATTSANGYLTSTDWNTFNGKENVLTFSSPLVRTSNTISMPAATTSVNGYLTSTDWNTFNNKQGALTLTTTGSSGSATLISNTLNIPTYTLAGLGGITASFLSGGTGITYNSGTGVIATTITQYTDALARASLSFTAGTGAYNSTTGVITIPTNTSQLTNGANFITLASLSGGTGISYNNTTGVITNTITQYTDALARAAISAGTGISYNSTTGVITNTITQYTDALARGAISLTTSGSSGASTYNSTTGVLNIPNYGSALSGYLPLTGGTLTGALNGTSASFSGLFTVVSSGNKSTIAIGNTASSTYSQLLMYGGLGKYNWSLGAQYNANNSFEITPSTTTEGTTFSTPILTIASTGAATFSSSVTAGSFLLTKGSITNDTGYGTGFNVIGSATTYIGSSTGIVGFIANNSEGMRLTSTGLGIGTTSPIAKFQVVGSSGAGIRVDQGNYNYYGAYNHIWMNSGFSSTFMTLDSSGNLGLGVTPSAWASGWKVIDIGSNTSLADGYGNTRLYYNAYNGTGGDIYKTTSQASAYTQTGGQHIWYNAPSGTAGTAISFTQAMTLLANGSLSIGKTTSTFGTSTRTSLELNGSTDSILALYSGGTLGGYLFANGIANTEWYSTGFASISTNGSERIRVFANGSVAIGTTTDSGYKLDVNGTGRFTDNLLVEKGQNTTTKVEAKNTTIGTSSDASFIATSDSSAGTTVFGKKSSGVTTYKILTQSSAYWYNGTAGDISIINDFSSGAIKLAAGGSSSANLTIASTGAATFSNSVTLGGDITQTGNSVFKNSSYELYLQTDSAKAIIFRPNTVDSGRITSGGNWLLGTATDNGERLYISGNVRATGTITANSDIRLKKNLERIENALEKVGQISGYTYDTIYDDKRHGGVIAQEIDEVFPEIVNKGNDGLLGVEYGNISALLIEALKELKEKNTALEARLQALEK